MKRIKLILALLVVTIWASAQTVNSNSSRDLLPVRNLEVAINDSNEVLITWDMPEDQGPEMTLSWSNMNMVNATGVGMGQCAVDAAQRFDAMDLRNLIGWQVENVSVILSPWDTTAMFGVPDPGPYRIRVWKGSMGSLEMVYDEEIENPVWGVPITYDVTDAGIFVEEGSELWVGFYIGCYTFAPNPIDDHPHVPNRNYNNYYYRDGDDCLPRYEWMEYDYKNNYCISSTLISPTGEKTNLGHEDQLTSGYCVYRDGSLVKTIPYSFVTYFIDTEYDKDVDVEYCVTAQYGEEESEAVCDKASFTAIGETGTEASAMRLYPNPATDKVYIEGAKAAEVQVYNALGQLVKTVQNANEVSLEDLPQGVYLLRVTLEGGKVFSDKVVKE